MVQCQKAAQPAAGISTEAKDMMDWAALDEACMSCCKCPLAETRHHVVFGEGARDAEVMLIGEGPGEQ